MAESPTRRADPGLSNLVLEGGVSHGEKARHLLPDWRDVAGAFGALGRGLWATADDLFGLIGLGLVALALWQAVSLWAALLVVGLVFLLVGLRLGRARGRS